MLEVVILNSQRYEIFTGNAFHRQEYNKYFLPVKIKLFRSQFRIEEVIKLIEFRHNNDTGSAVGSASLSSGI